MARAKLAVSKSPDAYRSIGEAASELGVQTHVLRYWEGKFPRQVKPVKRRDGRRMFRPADLAALRAVQLLVHKRGMTLKGARSLLDEQGVQAVLNGQAVLSATGGEKHLVASPAKDLQATLVRAFETPAPTANTVGGSRQRLETVLHEMNDLKAKLDAARLHRAA